MPKKLDQIQKAVKLALKKQFPQMKDDELTIRSFAIATKRFKDQQNNDENSKEKQNMVDIKKEVESAEAAIQENLEKKEVKLDEDGMIIVAENVPIIFTTSMYVKEE